MADGQFYFSPLQSLFDCRNRSFPSIFCIRAAPRQLSLASVSNMNVKSKSGKDKVLSMFVSSCLRLSNASLASFDSKTFLSVAFKC